MAYQAVFNRYEFKYLLSPEQKDRILYAMMPYMAPDPYGRTIIRNIYFDTNTYRLIRHSIEKPVYKEKLRIRSYRQADHDSTVFVELKKKYRSVVYKRRVSLSEEEAFQWLAGSRHWKAAFSDLRGDRLFSALLCPSASRGFSFLPTGSLLR